MKFAFRSTIFAVVAIPSFISGASADTLPASSLAGYFCAGVFMYCNPPLLKTYPAQSSASYGDANGTASVSVGGATSPAPNLFASATATGNASGYAQLSLTYYIELTGPSGSVPITINTAAYAGLNSQAATIIMNPKTFFDPYVASTSQGMTYVADNNSFVLPLGPGTSYDRSDVVTLVEGTIYEVAMSIVVNATFAYPQETASVDPYFSDIPAGYQLLISQGVGNAPFSSATPLPAAFPLFASGLGAIGALGWRKKRKARAV
jgi:hypothetical protein